MIKTTIRNIPTFLFLTILLGCGSGSKIATKPAVNTQADNPTPGPNYDVTYIENETQPDPAALPARRWTITGKTYTGATGSVSNSNAVVSVYSLTEMEYLVGNIKVNATGAYSITINDTYSGSARIKVCAAAPKMFDDCEEYDMQPGTRTQPMKDLRLMPILTGCNVEAPVPASVVYGQAVRIDTTEVSAPSENRMEIYTKALYLNSTELPAAKYSRVERGSGASRYYTWVFKELGSIIVHYTFVDTQSKAAVACKRTILVSKPARGLNAVYKATPDRDMEEMATDAILGNGILPFVGFDNLSSTGSFPLPVGLPTNHSTYWGVQIDGYLDITTAGIYEFNKDSDGSTSITIDGRSFTDLAGPVNGGNIPMNLAVGLHPIHIDYLQASKNYKLILKWKTATGMGTVPYTVFRQK